MAAIGEGDVKNGRALMQFHARPRIPLNYCARCRLLGSDSSFFFPATCLNHCLNCLMCEADWHNPCISSPRAECARRERHEPVCTSQEHVLASRATARGLRESFVVPTSAKARPSAIPQLPKRDEHEMLALLNGGSDKGACGYKSISLVLELAGRQDGRRRRRQGETKAPRDTAIQRRTQWTIVLAQEKCLHVYSRLRRAAGRRERRKSSERQGKRSAFGGAPIGYWEEKAESVTRSSACCSASLAGLARSTEGRQRAARAN